MHIRTLIKRRQRRNDELRSSSVMQRVHVQTGTTALCVVPLMRREMTAKWENKPLCITVSSSFCNGMMTRGTVHTDMIRRYATSLDPALEVVPQFCFQHTTGIKTPIPEIMLNTIDFLLRLPIQSMACPQRSLRQNNNVAPFIHDIIQSTMQLFPSLLLVTRSGRKQPSS
jgi:hypothetical protein